jgi:nitrogen-specific signal transduction histidine kinase
MSADRSIQYLSGTFFVLSFVGAAIQAMRHPHSASTGIALIFIVPTLTVAAAVAAAQGLARSQQLRRACQGIEPRVFLQVCRAPNVDDRRFAAMGPGLRICSGIAKQHGGQIGATSPPGYRNTFHVALPLVPQEVTIHG